ncbi:glycerol-3-phosphate 1-O-acyltransferase PlsY [bacterium]|nr:glycerol-3-phosphate 1-O-acyltransferase PlsY [bacterium]
MTIWDRMFSFLIIFILAYLLGSFPTAILLSKIMMKDDIRNHGSGNAGATNVFRIMGWKAALIVVLIDIGKGIVATLFLPTLIWQPVPFDMVTLQILTGVAAIVGHVWTVFAGFRGGKGVGTAFGVLVALIPLSTTAAGIIWLILVLVTRIVSVGSLVAGILFPIAVLLERTFFNANISASLIGMAFLVALLIVITHRSNIKRLLKGEENRFGSKKKRPQGKG